MAILQLIRHAQTVGNQQKRYIGSTNEPLSQNGKRELEKWIRLGIYKPAEIVYTSPMLRCIETVALIFENTPQESVSELSECDFGEFEGKTYEELSENAAYRMWLDSGGNSAIPDGEDLAHFKARCCGGLEKVISNIITRGYNNAAIVMHGGSIMAIMERYDPGRAGFYEWQVRNCCSIMVTVEESVWRERHMFSHAEKVFPC
jgi:alpha-ribazole phosphatase